MKNLGAALEGAGSSFSLLTKCTILLINMEDFAKVNAVYQSYFEEGRYPARACFAVKALPKNSQLEIEGVAVRSSISGIFESKAKEA